MSKRKTQQDLLIEHKALFELIVIISNQIIRQAQLVDILLVTNYSKNRTAVTRLLQKLEESKLIIRGKEENSKYRYVQATKTAIKFVKGPNASPNKPTNGTREVRNAVMVELFRLYFLKPEMTLEEATTKAIKGTVSNLFGSDETFYNVLSKNKLAFHSFNSKSSSFFKQKDEIEYYMDQKRNHFDESVRPQEGAKKKINKIDQRCWTLKTLKKRNTFLISATLMNPPQLLKDDWIDAYYKEIEGFEPKMLTVKFAIVTLSTDPNNYNLTNSILNVIKFVKRSFKMHYNYFIQKNEIKKAITNIHVIVDVILLNEIALKNVDQEDCFKLLEKKLKRHQTVNNFKYTYKINFKSVNVNEHNEHLNF